MSLHAFFITSDHLLPVGCSVYVSSASSVIDIWCHRTLHTGLVSPSLRLSLSFPEHAGSVGSVQFVQHQLNVVDVNPLMTSSDFVSFLLEKLLLTAASVSRWVTVPKLSRTFTACFHLPSIRSRFHSVNWCHKHPIMPFTATAAQRDVCRG